MTQVSVERLERVLGRVLGIGVTASTVCLTAGLLMTFAFGNTRVATALLSVGIVVLLATPVARVAVSSVGYARRRDWLFVTLTLVVFVELIATIVAALR
jgi:uncharacterized membrane protein